MGWIFVSLLNSCIEILTPQCDTSRGRVAGRWFGHKSGAFMMGFSQVQFSHLSHVWLFATSWTAARQAYCPSPTPGACSNSCSSRWWCHPTISSSVPSPPAFSLLWTDWWTESFQMSQFFTSGSQSIGVSASASVLPMNIQGWFPLGWTDWILQSKGLSRVFSNTTVQKHQFFGAQLSL